MNYLVLGAGGTGGALGAFLSRGGKAVTLIARGEHLSAIRERGLRIIGPSDSFTAAPIAASDMEHYDGKPDVILVCVKGYSLEETVPFLRRITDDHTVVIPILNLYGTGERLQQQLPETLVTDGCIYVASEIRSPGCILMRGSILRVVFGPRLPEENRPALRQIETELNECGIQGILSENIQRDTMKKFSYISPQCACGIYYNITAGAMQHPGQYRDCFMDLVGEIVLLAKAMGITFDIDPVQYNLKIIDALDPKMTTSLQRDLERGGPSEIEGLVFAVLQMGDRCGAALPKYRQIAAELKRRGLGGPV